jgi:hypothetical protein
MATVTPDSRRRLELWLQMPEAKQTEHDVLSFYGWLRMNYPMLIPAGPGDPYRKLQAELSSYTREKPQTNKTPACFGLRSRVRCHAENGGLPHAKS